MGRQEFVQEKEQGDLLNHRGSETALQRNLGDLLDHRGSETAVHSAQEESKMSMAATKAILHDDAPASEASTIPTLAEINAAVPHSEVVAARETTAERYHVRGEAKAEAEPKLDDAVVTPAKTAKGCFCS